MRHLAILSLLVITIMVSSGCQPVLEETNTVTPIGDSGDLREVKNSQELKEILAANQNVRNNFLGFGGDIAVRSFAVADAVEESAIAAPSIAQDGDDFSKTNVQVEGVDEADIVKTDGSHIYLVHQNTVQIISAETNEIVEEITLKSSSEWPRAYAQQIFLHNNKLILFVQDYEQEYAFAQYDIQPYPQQKPFTSVQIYDISEPSTPELIEKIDVSGNYFQSRMVDGNVFLIANEGVWSWPVPFPIVRTESNVVRPQVFSFDQPEDNYQFATIASIDVEEADLIDAKSYLVGYASTVMMTPENLYIAQQATGWYYGGYSEERFTEVILPMLPQPLRSNIFSIRNEGLDDAEEWDKISQAMTDYFGDDLEEHQSLFEDIADALEEYDVRQALERSRTIINKFSIKDGEINHIAKGDVTGRLLNQFSMDEHNSNLRVATTTDIWARQRITHNNVYTLDENLNKIGELEGIAPDERIFSTRFIGDRLYMTTFRQIDPFFVIDLSENTPKVLGELKIPGFSDYLHPFDENHIIGVGKETKANEFGFETGGVKIALFDVSDVTKPDVVDSIEIGVRGSQTPISSDHKAFLFDKQRELMVLPIAEIQSREQIDRYRYSNSIWNGAYVFEISSDGFEERAAIEHSSFRTDYFSWWDGAQVSRSLTIGDNLYTVSDKFVKVNAIEDDFENVASISLPQPKREEFRYFDEPIPVDIGGSIGDGAEPLIAVEAEVTGE